MPPILEHGGEVLKFIGDGLLAIFPLAENGDDARRGLPPRARLRARSAQALIDALGNAARRPKPIRFGLALHVGQVMYGNIGGGNRLDFTCIGPAVNLAARLEKIAAAARPDHRGVGGIRRRMCRDEFNQLGECTVAGFAAPQAVFGLTGSPQ